MCYVFFSVSEINSRFSSKIVLKSLFLPLDFFSSSVSVLSKLLQFDRKSKLVFIEGGLPDRCYVQKCFKSHEGEKIIPPVRPDKNLVSFVKQPQLGT